MTKQIVWMMSLVIAVSISPAWGRGAPDSFADLAEKLLPAVVNISTQQQQEQQQSPFGGGNDFFFQFPPGSPFGDFFDRFNRRFGDNMPQQHSLGSGFIIDARGYVVTNNHVIDQASEIEVILQDETSLSGDSHRTRSQDGFGIAENRGGQAVASCQNG